jgi:hypothetical protein
MLRSKRGTTTITLGTRLGWQFAKNFFPSKVKADLLGRLATGVKTAFF